MLHGKVAWLKVRLMFNFIQFSERPNAGGSPGSLTEYRLPYSSVSSDSTYLLRNKYGGSAI